MAGPEADRCGIASRELKLVGGRGTERWAGAGEDVPRTCVFAPNCGRPPTLLSFVRPVIPLFGGRGTLRAAGDGMVRAVPTSPAVGLGRLRVIGLGTLRALDAIAGFDPRPGTFGAIREGAAVPVRPANGF